MKSCIVLACMACVSAACGSQETFRPVDGKFNVTVEGDGVPEGSVVSVDVFWLPNGQVDVRFDDVDGVIPGPDELKGVAFKEGNDVRVEGPVALEEGAEPDQVRLEGSIDPDALDLELSDTPPGGATATVRLHGDARPFGSIDATDGEYLAFAEHYPAKCPGTDRPPIPGSNTVLDVLEAGDGSRLKLYDRLVFTVPIADGSVASTVEFKDLWYLSLFDASVTGTLVPSDFALTLDVPDPASGDGCVDRLVLTGAKRLPVATAIDGDYRADYVWRDECFDEEGKFSAPVKLLAQDEGKYVFTEFDGSTMEFSMTAGEPYTGHFIDFFGSGADIVYDGVIDAPNLSYTGVYTYPYEEECTVTLTVTAYKRYFFPSEGATTQSLRQGLQRNPEFRRDTYPRRFAPAAAAARLHRASPFVSADVRSSFTAR